MAKVQADQPLVPSVLDRLLDDEPHLTREPAKLRRQLLRDLRDSVRRDLEYLLNSRRRYGELSAAWADLMPSLAHYGLPDFTAHSAATEQGKEALRTDLERAIRLYEPRFKSVRVELLTNADPLDRTLRFRVDAILYAEPAPEPAVFDSTLEPVSGTFKITEGGP